MHCFIRVAIISASIVTCCQTEVQAGPSTQAVASFVKEETLDCSNTVYPKGNYVEKQNATSQGENLTFYFINYKDFTCNGKHDFCGATGNCSQQVVVKTENKPPRVVFDQSIIDAEIIVVGGLLVLKTQTHVGDCQVGQSERGDKNECLQKLVWNGETFVEISPPYLSEN